MLRPFTTALLVIAHNWKQLKCPTIGTGRMNYSIPAMEFHEMGEGNEEALYTLLRREQQDTLLKDKRKSVKCVYHATTYLRTERWGIKIRINQNNNYPSGREGKCGRDRDSRLL